MHSYFKTRCSFVEIRRYYAEREMARSVMRRGREHEVLAPFRRTKHREVVAAAATTKTDDCDHPRRRHVVASVGSSLSCLTSTAAA